MAKPARKKKKPAKTTGKSSKKLSTNSSRTKATRKKTPAGGDTSSPTRDAPWDVDLADDGDIASPRIDLDEQEIKDREDRSR